MKNKFIYVLKIILAILLYILFMMSLMWPGGANGFITLLSVCHSSPDLGICELKQSGDEKGLKYFALIGIIIIWIYANIVLFWQYQLRKNGTMQNYKKYFTIGFLFLILLPFIFLGMNIFFY